MGAAVTLVPASYQVMPPLSAEERAELRADIADRGVMVPVEYDEQGNILDGHHRVELCAELGIANWPRLIRYGLSEPDKLTHARRLNLSRRHLDQAQRRALIDAELKQVPQASDRRIADGLGVDHKTVGAARDRLESTGEIPQLDKREGRDSRLRQVVQFVPSSPAEQRGLQLSIKAIRAEKQEEKRERRADREHELGEAQAPTGSFGLIVEDYEWDYAVWSRETGMDRHAANHYPVSDDAHLAEEIVARTSDRLTVAVDNCLLAMWSTVPHLAIALDVLRLRGFRYVSHYVWGKDRVGTGHWNRNKHEILLFGVKGNIPCPSPGTQWDSLIMAAVGEHSRKPDAFLEMLEAYFPSLPKIELNARRERPGWKAWGLEAPHDPDTGEILEVPEQAPNGGTGEDGSCTTPHHGEVLPPGRAQVEPPSTDSTLIERTEPCP